MGASGVSRSTHLMDPNIAAMALSPGLRYLHPKWTGSTVEGIISNSPDLVMPLSGLDSRPVWLVQKNAT